MSELIDGFGETSDGPAFKVTAQVDRFEALDLANALTAAGQDIMQCAATGEAPSPNGAAASGALFLLEAARALIGALAKEAEK